MSAKLTRPSLAISHSAPFCTMYFSPRTHHTKKHHRSQHEIGNHSTKNTVIRVMNSTGCVR